MKAQDIKTASHAIGRHLLFRAENDGAYALRMVRDGKAHEAANAARWAAHSARLALRRRLAKGTR